MGRVEAYAHRNAAEGWRLFNVARFAAECLKLRDAVSKPFLGRPRHNQRRKALPSDFDGTLPVTAEHRGVSGSFI